MKLLKVGGCVRDMLLGLEPNDVDYLAPNETEESMVKQGYERVGKSSTAPVFIVDGHEVSIPRTETSRGPGHSEFTYNTGGITVEDDLYRRDFTINAMAMDGDKLIDPYGGKSDLERGILRMIDGISFKEDPLRVLRAARFAARFGFYIEFSTLTLCCTMCNEGALGHLSKERIFGELKKGFQQCKKPSEYMKTLLMVGALKVILPEISAMIRVPQPPKHHREGSVWDHTMLALDICANLSTASPEAMFSILFHDIGKTLTDPADYPSHHNHTGPEAVELMEKIGKRIGMDKHTLKLCCSSVADHMLYHKVDEMTMGKIVKLFRKFRINQRRDMFLNFLVVGFCDFLGRVPRPSLDDDPGRRWCELADKFCKFKLPYREGGYTKDLVLQLQIEYMKGVCACYQ